MITIGRPGGHARFLQRKHLATAIGSSIALFALVIIAFLLPLPLLIQIMLLLAASLVGAYLFADARKKAGRAGIGAESEESVFDLLTRSEGLVACGLLLGAGGDLDMLFIHPRGALAIEIKTGFGSIQNVNGSLKVGKRFIPGDATGQVLRQYDGLLHHFPELAGYSQPVVVIPQGRGQASVNGVLVLSNEVLEQQAANLLAPTEVFTPEQIQAFAKRAKKLT